MDTPKGFNKVTKTRALYYEKRKGLFLIKTNKSNDRWTTPGGRIETNEEELFGLTRLIFNELGIIPKNIESTPLYERSYNSSKYKESITVKGFLTEFPIPINLMNGKKTEFSFEFFPVESLLNNLIPITRDTYNILNSYNFLKMYRKSKI